MTQNAYVIRKSYSKSLLVDEIIPICLRGMQSSSGAKKGKQLCPGASTACFDCVWLLCY